MNSAEKSGPLYYNHITKKMQFQTTGKKKQKEKGGKTEKKKKS